MNAEPLVVTTRGVAGDRDEDPTNEVLENVHHGSVAVVSLDGRLRYRAGDPDYLTFTRSALKPLQAIAFVREGGPARFGWGSEATAMMCASHSGEAMHVDRVAAMLASTDCDAAMLQCGCHVPGWYAALGRDAPPDLALTPLQHNCSGKHAGFLAACRLHGEPVANYIDPDSALQRRVATAVAHATGLAPHEMVAGTDGCSAPNYAMPLSRLALGYARLAQGADAPFEGAACAALADAMTTHPELVSGTARSDLSLMKFGAGDWVTKIGADGVQAIGIRSAGIGIAIKIADGSRDALYVAVIETLRQLGCLPGHPDGLPPDLVRLGNRLLRNARGRAVGRVISRFTLRAA